jgi:hypothetical protein
MHSELAAAAGHPLIDIDWTVAVQAVLFLVMFVLANKLLFQPYLALREKRIAKIDGAREEAVRINAEVDAMRADYEQKLAATRNDGRSAPPPASTSATSPTPAARPRRPRSTRPPPR